MSVHPPFNPAAVLGYATPGFIQVDSHLHVYRKGTGAKYDGSVRQVTAAAQADLAALGLSAKQLELPNAYPGTLELSKLRFDEVLQVCGILVKHGLTLQDPLFAEQVRVAMHPSVPANYATAYADFEKLADGFFAQLPVGLKFIEDFKQPANVDFPLRARAITAGSAGVYLTPDPDRSRYVRLMLRGASHAEALLVRDDAHDFFEPMHMRVDFAIAPL